jgi:hypothetical protein
MNTADERIEERKGFRSVFCDTADGPAVLTWILNELGYFSTDPQLIDPVMMAFCNRILNKIGIVHAENLLDDVQARQAASNDRDLLKLKQMEESHE